MAEVGTLKIPRPPEPGRSFADVCPDLVGEWDRERNTLRPEDVSAGCSSIKIVWKCPKAPDHIWEACPRDRARGSGCPACRGLVASSTNNLADHPSAIAREWHPTLNGELTPRDVVVNSRAIVWWQCQVVPSHIWQARINNRISGGTGCPDCAKYGRYKRVSADYNLLVVHPGIAAEWHESANDPVRPEDVLPFSNDVYWWTCPAGHDYEMQVNERTSRRYNCPYCRNRRVDSSNSLAGRRPDLAAEWDQERNVNLKPEQVAWATNRPVHWKCGVADDHRWRAPVVARTRSGTGCPFCAGQQVSVTNSLATRNPEAAKEWLADLNEGLRADQVVAGSTKPGRWQCPNHPHHVYTMPIRVRALVGHTCPECSMASMSRIEIVIRHELAALLGVDPRRSRISGAGLLGGVDMRDQCRMIVVEFDGAYWHAGREDDDTRKSEALAALGWRVIRIRQHPLPLLGEHDVPCPTSMTPAQTADTVAAVGRMIEGITGERIPGLDAYASARILKLVSAFEAELRERRQVIAGPALECGTSQMELPIAT